MAELDPIGQELDAAAPEGQELAAAQTSSAPQRGLLDRAFDWLTGSEPLPEVKPTTPEESYKNRQPTNVDELIKQGKAKEVTDADLKGMIPNAPPPWEKIRDDFNMAFPGTDPKENEKLYNRARDLQIRRIGARPESQPQWGRPADEFMLNSILPTTPVTNALDNIKAKHVREAFDRGEDVDPKDMDFLARYDQQQALNRDRSMGGRLTGMGLALPGQILTLKAGQAAGAMMGLGARAAAWFGLGGFTAEQAFEHSTERAMRPGAGEFYEPQNAAPAVAMAGLQALIMHGAGKYAQGFSTPIRRAAVEVGTGFGGLQGLEVAAGGLDEFLKPAWKTDTHYGVIGKLVNGEKGEALQETVSQILSIAAVSFLHSGPRGENTPIPEKVLKLISEGIGEKAKPEPPPEPPPRPGPNESTEETTRRQQQYEQRRREWQQREDERRRQAADNLRKRVDSTAEDILGVKPDDTMAEITRRFRQRANESHPDRGGTSEEFQWVQWAYKTLQARAEGRPGPKKRPGFEYKPGAREAGPEQPEEQARAQQPPPPPNEPEAPPYEPQARASTAKMADGQETALEGPPASAGGEAPESPPVAPKGPPELIPDGIRARFEDLVKRRQQARLVDDFETEIQTGRDLTDLIKEYPRLRESTAPFAKPRRVAADTSDMGQQTPRERADRLTGQLHEAMSRLEDAKSLERRELLSKGMKLSHRADEASQIRQQWEDRVKTLRQKVDAAREEVLKSGDRQARLPDLTDEQLARQPWELQTPPGMTLPAKKPTILDRMRARQAARKAPIQTPGRPEPTAPRPPRTFVGEPHDYEDLIPSFDGLMEAKGLKPNEKALLREMFTNRTSVDKLAEDPKYGPRTGGGIHAMSVRLLGKLGYKGTVQSIFDEIHKELTAEIEANGEKLEHGAVGGHVQKGEKGRKKLIHRVTAEEARANRWADYIKKAYSDGPLDAEDVSRINEAIEKGENPPGYDQTKRGKKLAAKRAARAADRSPVPAGAGESVPESNPPTPATPSTPETGEGAGPTPAKTTRKPGSGDLSIGERSRRAKAPPEVLQEAQRMGIPWEDLHKQSAEVNKMDRDLFELKNGVLQYARKTFAAMAQTEPYITNLGDFQTYMNFRKQVPRGKVDAASIRGLDIVARSVGNAYPELFDQNVNEAGWDEQLFDMLVAGKPNRMSTADTYHVALEYLSALKEATTPTPEMVKEWNDELKASNQKPLTQAETREVQAAASEESQGREAEGLHAEDEGSGSEIDSAIFDPSFNVDELAAFGGGDEPGSGAGTDDITTAGADYPTEPAAPGEPAPGGGAGDGVTNWQDRFVDAPPGTQTNFLPGSFGSLTGTQGELFDRTPIDNPKQLPSMPGQRNFIDELGRIAEDFRNDTGAAVDIDTLIRGAQYVRDTIGRLSGKSNPATTRLDRETGEALMRWMVADQYGREAAGFYADLVLGKNHTQLDRLKFGQMLDEMRLGYMRVTYRRLGNNANVRAAKQAAKRARVALRAGVNLAKTTRAAAAGKAPGSPEWLAHERVMAAVRAQRRVMKDLERKARTIGKYNKLANGVGSTIGQPGLPFQTHQEFYNYRDSAEGRTKRSIYAKEVVPVFDAIYERSLGLAQGQAHSRSITQIPGLTVHLKPLFPGDLTNRPGMYMSKQGPRNLKMKKNKYARQAKGNAPGYDVDFVRKLEDSFAHLASTAAQAEFARTAEANGVAMWAKPYQKAPGFKEVSPFTAPPRGTQLARPGDVLYVRDAMHDETMNAFNADHKNSAIAAIKFFNGIATAANLTSFVDAASHGLNLAGALLTAPSGTLGGIARTAGNVAASKALTGLENKNLLPDMMKGIQRRLMNDTDIRRKLLEATRTGMNKPNHHSEGMVVGLAQKVADLTNKQLPEKVRKIRFADPTFYLSHAMDNLSDIVRLSMIHAYDSMAAKGMVADTETGRRDFVNQFTGNYERKAMNWLARIFRDTGFGPFVVAGTTMTSRAIRTLILDPGTRGTGWKGETRMRMEMLAKIMAALAAGALVNYMMWGRLDGDDNTPRFGIKIAEGEDGKSINLPNPVGMMLNRALRAVPFLSYGVDKATGTSPPSEAENKVYDFAESWAHPFFGPALQFLHTAWTGKDAMGRKIAAPAGEDSSKPRENVKAAIKQLNPVFSALSGAYKPGEEIPLNERLAKLMGPFGFRYSEKQPSEIAALYDLGDRIRETQDKARIQAKNQGEMAAPNPRLNVIQRAEVAISKLERQRHTPGLTQEARQKIRADQVELATSALQTAKELKSQ
jgi:hypothetical protein